MMDVGRHPRIKLLAYSEVEEISGYVGNFRARIRRKARYIREEDCTACGDCAKVCPVVKPDEYQQGFSSRKAVHIPFPQAVPSAYLIRKEDCLGLNPIACGKCAEACEKKCMDYDMSDRFLELEVGVIVVATGMEPFDPATVAEYGYRRYPNVISSMEFERLICAGGPTEGHFLRPGDGSRPKRIGFIQCVGSRSRKDGQLFCSNICCMNTVKDTLLLADHYPDTESTVFYTDIRAFGKGFEDLYQRSREVGVQYVRGLPGEIREDSKTGNLLVRAENGSTGRLEDHEFDLMVLSVGFTPQNGNGKIHKLLTLSHTSDGFLLESHPKLKPVDAPTKGVFFAGTCEAPKDIKDSVTQAGAASARAGILLSAGKVKIEAITSRLIAEKCTGCNVCVKACPYSAILPGDAKKKIPVSIVEACCSGCGTCAASCRFDAIEMRHFTDNQIYSQMDAILEENPREKIVTFACNWCSYAGGDFAGVSRLAYPASSRLIRTMCSGRVTEDFIYHAFRKGAAMVLVSGCHFADCHYINANRWTQRRVDHAWDRLEKLKIRPERLQLEWISAAEGQKFAKVMRELDEIRKTVTIEEVQDTIAALSKPGK